MTEWFKQNLTLYSTPDSRAAGKLSVLAIIEVIASVAIYWWIATVWETQLHILVSLIAAPLYLLRSDESVTKAQVMWDEYDSRVNTINKHSFIFWCLLFCIGLTSGLICYFLCVHWLGDYQGWAMFWRGALLGWLALNISIAVAVAILGLETVMESVMEILLETALGALLEKALEEGSAAIAFGIVGAGLGAGLWLRSLLTRIMAVSASIIKGIKNAPTNWQRGLWVEDFTLAPELIPGITIVEDFRFEFILKSLKSPNDIGSFVVSTLILPIFFLPALIWRLSLKSTMWFYAPIFLMSKPGDLAEADNRLRFFTRGPTLWEIWKMCFAVIGLTVAVISLIDIFVAFEFWRGLSNEAPLSPIGWLLVMDWERFFNQPWQWFSLPAAFLTVFLYLWVNQIRVHRDADVKLGQDPEVHNSAANHPGITIYWLDRLRNVLVVVSLVIGLWYFAKWAYLADKLTPINPWLSSIFGPLPL